jgi:hypothetical protein
MATKPKHVGANRKNTWIGELCINEMLVIFYINIVCFLALKPIVVVFSQPGSGP